MSAITAKASRKMKKYAVLTREPRCFLGSFDFSWEQRKFSDVVATRRGLTYKPSDIRKNGVRVLRSSNIAEDSFVLSDEDVFVVREAVNIDCVRANDILITAANGSSRLVGKHTIISGIPEESAVHGGFMLLGTTKEPHFVNASMGSSWYRRFIELFVAGGNGAIGNLNKNDLDNQDIAIPSEKEQKKIGSFFRQLDNLITLHQSKCVFLFGFFQAFISMIFTASTFSWEQRKLGDVVKEITRNDPESEAPIMMITANNGFIEQSERYAFNNAGESLKKYILLKKGELAYNHGASKLRPYGSCFALTTAENARIPFVYHCFSAENQNAEFMSIELNGAEIENQLRKIVSSGARMDGLLNISFDEYTSVSVLLPGTEEQDRIADFFRHLDNLITLHQRECISFTARAGRRILTANKKRNTSSWEQRKFEEIAVRSSVICSDDTLPRVEYEDIVSGTGRLNKDIYAKQSIKSGIAFHQGDVLYGKLRPYLQNWLLPTFDGLAVGDFWVLQPQNADSSFLYRLIQSRQFDEVANQSTGTKMPRADWKLVSKTVFSIPSNISEQAAIGTYFTALDSLITLHQRKPFLMKWRTSDANRNQTNRLVL